MSLAQQLDQQFQEFCRRKAEIFRWRQISLCWAVLLIILLALIVTFFIYPFIATADGIARINIAIGNKDFSLLPPLQSQLFKYSIDITGGMGLYTVIQVIVFYLSVLLGYVLLLKSMSFNLIFALALTTICIPIFLVFPTILTDSALVFSCLVFVEYLIMKVSASESVVLNFLIYIGVLFFLFGMRFNAIIVAPVILILIYFYAPTFKILGITGMLISICFVWLLNDMVRQKSRPEALSLAWEIIGVAHEVDDDDKLRKILNFCGDTDVAISRYHTKFLNPIFWDQNPPLPVNCIVSIEGSQKVKIAYFNVLREYPFQWIKVKLDFWLGTYGISQPLENIRRGFHSVDDFTIRWGGG